MNILCVLFGHQNISKFKALKDKNRTKIGSKQTVYCERCRFVEQVWVRCHGVVKLKP